tara:strand:- start:904 stop:1182 length:279 start_codon:yes stop_codon:yes gene_type:complete
MAKKEEVVDLKPQKLTEEELKSLQELVTKIEMLQREAGVLEQRKHGVLHALTTLQDQVNSMQGELEKIYGKADVDVRTGELKYHENNGKANS